MMNRKKQPPLILVNMAVAEENGAENEVLNSAYAQRIVEAGAVPFLIPSVENDAVIDTLLEMADGVLLIGGKDYPPYLYDAPAHPETDCSRLRPQFDMTLARAALRRKMPILGICGGCQLLNIAIGGKLIQHLPNAALHTGGKMHEAVIRQDGYFSNALQLHAGDSFMVNSYHHQAVDPAHLGEKIAVTAQAWDGTVEAIELQEPGRMVLGVQFHPERMDDLAPRLFGLLRDQANLFLRKKDASKE